MSRVTFTLSDELSTVVTERPDELDLDPELSQSQRFALLVADGAALRRARRAERERQAAYTTHSTDPAHRESVDDLFNLAVEGGLI
jgi:hypothetical protein